MKALVKHSHGTGNIDVRDMQNPVLQKEDWVVIKVKAAGVCGTDLHVWEDKFSYWPPVILGHEFSGEVIDAGPSVKSYRKGDRVVAEPNTGGCGICQYCRSGRMHMCPEKLTLGWRIDGCFADFISLPELVLHKIPDDLSYEIAALCEPLAICVYDVSEHSRIVINDFVVVQGSGPIGIISAYVAKSLGARFVLMSGMSAGKQCRFDAAKKLGVDRIVNIEEENLFDAVMDLTGGKGADCVIETSGNPSAVKQCVSLLKRNGRITAIGLPADDDIVFPWKSAVLKDLDVYFNMSSSYTSWDKALGMLNRDRKLFENVITRLAVIDDWESVFTDLLNEKDVKAVFQFDG